MNINKQYIELLKALTTINPSVLILREGETNLTRMLNVTKDIFYELIAPKESFDFEGDCIGFFAFPEFHDLYSAFGNTEVTQLDARRLKIVDVDSNDAFTYSTHERTFIKGTYKGIDPTDNHFKFLLTDKMRASLKSRAGLVNAERIVFKSIEGEDAVRVTMVNTKSENDFSFAIRKTDELPDNGHILDATGARTELDIVFPAGVISKLPNGDYDVEVSNTGLICFKLKAEGISLSVLACCIDTGV